MNSKRAYYLMVGSLVLFVLAIFGGTYLANQQLHKQSAKLLGYKTQSEVLSREQVGLTKAKKDVAKYDSLEKIAQTIVPQDKDQAEAVRQIVNIAADAGIQPTSITFPVSTLGGPKAVSAPGSTATSSSAATPKQSLSQLTPVKGMKGVYILQITIHQDASSAVPYDKFIDFLGRLEQNRRTAQVTGIVLQPSSTDRNKVSFTLTVDEYIKP